ncbi:S8 family serine peptidase [Priestia megaterium]|uniref:S8 family serine peptidase n=1 Tax=Priestia megaterium TaxID=1404 RepID=A0A6H1P6P0_PRIMG|nr:S8 family serine peptidase [Priestia megaterium]QIZ09188.1 S8 family serine peptidase [Priestia megaterium]
MKKRNQWFNGRTATWLFTSTLVFSSAKFPFVAPTGLAQGINANEAMTHVIVEMDGAPVIRALPKSEKIGAASKTTVSKLKEQTESLKQAHGKMLQALNEKRIPFNKSNEYTFTLNGMALQVPKNKVDELRSLPGVKAVYPDQEYHADLADSVPLIGAPDVWSKHDQNNQGITGKGVTVAVIDTGVDYDHPDLGGGFGPGHKVVGGYDFVNHDNDPMDDQGHGTHVSGIIAAHGNVTGVAPDASITAYKVLNQYGEGDDSDIIAGIEASISPDNPFPADVINMSISGPGDGNDPLSQAAQNAVDAGVVVVASAGNSGPGYGTIGAPAMAEGVLAVGASTSGIKVPAAKMVSPLEENLSIFRLGFTANPPEAETTRELVDVGEGGLENYNGLDVKGKIVLIQLPQGADPQQYSYTAGRTAQEKGAEAALFFRPMELGPQLASVFKLGESIPSQYSSNLSGEMQEQDQFLADSSGDSRLETLVAMAIDETKAEELKSYLAKGPVKITISGKDATDKMASFSSRGNSDLRAKPDLVAPGVEINSTYINESGYTRMSGTSMAAPHVAGAAALLKQLKPDWNAREISSALKETTKPLASYDVLTQGAGRLDIKAAAETNVVASPNTLNLGIADIKDSKIHKSASLTLNNHGEKPVDMDFTVKDDTKSEAAVTVNPSHIHIEPGQQVNVEVSINMNRPDQDTVISGWIEGNIQSPTESQHLREPYQFTVRHLQITATPDPVASSMNETEAFIYSPLDLSQAPKVTIRTPSGNTNQVTPVLDHDHWWRVPVQTSEVGIYRIDAISTVKNSSTEESSIIGSGYLEKLPADKEHVSSWDSVGPYSNNGLMTFDPKNPNSMTVLTRENPSLFRKEDGTDTWHEYRNFPVQGGSPKKMVVDPTNARNIYVPINSMNKNLDSTYMGKILASKDGGKTWRTLPFPDIEISDLVIDESGQKLVAITKNEVYVSLDRGMNWEKLSGWWSWLTDAELVNNDLYLSDGTTGIYVLKDVFSGSATSEKLFQPLYRDTKEILGNQDILIARTGYSGLYASFNKGKDWKEITHDQVRFTNITALKILDGGIYVGTAYDGIWVSRDYGKTWESWKKPLPDYNSSEIDFALGTKSSPFGNRPVYVSSEQAGIYETQNKGETYNRVGIPGATVYDLAISKNSKGYQLLAGTDSETYRTALPDQNKIDSATLEWGAAQGEGKWGEQVVKIASSPTEPNVVYKIRNGDGFMYVYRSKDGGQNWDLNFVDGSVPTGMLVHPANPNEIVIPYVVPRTGEVGLWISKDGGENWKKIIQEKHIFTAIAGDPKDPNRIWAGGEDGLFLSKDMGQSFQKIQNVPVSSLAIDSNNSNHLVVGGTHLYVSTDGGKTLEKAKYAGSELDMFVNDIIVSPSNPNVIYAATGSYIQNGFPKGGRGVLMSVDGGVTWTNISEGLENKNTTALVLSPDEEYLFVGTYRSSVKRIKLPNKQR